MVMKFLSLGAGVQSSVMLMRAIHGDIEKPDHVIFADTGWEPAHIYEHLQFLKSQCEKASIDFHMVKAGDIRADMINARTKGEEYSGRWASMPLFIKGKGIDGMVVRQCTKEYKIEPLKKLQRNLLGYKKGQRIPPASAELWIGISTDELSRAKISPDKWIDNVYPLIDPLKMSRIDCQIWWENHYPHISLKKSACIGCPYTNDLQWLDMKLNRPDEFKDACDFDAAIRKCAQTRGDSFVHRSCKPLAEIKFNESQNTFDFDDELYCAGGFGL